MLAAFCALFRYSRSTAALDLATDSVTYLIIVEFGVRLLWYAAPSGAQAVACPLHKPSFVWQACGLAMGQFGRVGPISVTANVAQWIAFLKRSAHCEYHLALGPVIF